MRTQTEIEAEVAALKKLLPTIPPRSFFGDDNKAAVEIQIKILEEGVPDHKVGIFEDGTDNTLSAIDEVVEWRKGTKGFSAPSEGWQEIANEE